MTNCGHASGVTYKGCMKCDLDAAKERIAELEAANENFNFLCDTYEQVIDHLHTHISGLEATIKRVEALPGKWDQPIGKPSIDEAEFKCKMQRRTCAAELRAALQDQK